MKKQVILATVAAAVALSAPALAQNAPGPKGKKPAEAAPAEQKFEKSFPQKVLWTLIEMNGKPVPSGDELTFTIDDNFRGTGYGGCNSWSASMNPQKGQTIVMGPIAITKKTCDKGVMEREVFFLVSLRSGPVWDLEGSQMTIKSPRGAMRFQRSL